MLAAGGLKLAAKRTAFGDVSNTINVSRPSKDDLAIGGKGDISNSEKVTHAPSDKKTTSFLRPAQRPLSVSGSKTISNGPASIQSLANQPSLENPETTQVPNPAAHTRKIVTKKSTAVFKDTAATQIDQCVPDLQQPGAPVAPVAPVHRGIPPRQQSGLAEEHQGLQPKLTCQQSKSELETKPPEKAFEPQSVQPSSEDLSILRSDGIYMDEHGQLQLYDYVDPVELPEVVPVEKEISMDGGVSKQSARTVIDQITDAPLLKSQPTRKSTLTTVSEPEEYWDDEGEENCDEDGYVTARSFKARGENTTGGATTVLFPKVNLKIKKEIAAAKDLIERSKTAEELEDEAWDTTMVAEYGEEIFQYMKDLEVMKIWFTMGLALKSAYR